MITAAAGTGLPQASTRFVGTPDSSGAAVSTIVMSCVALALVLRIDVENRRLMRGTVL